MGWGASIQEMRLLYPRVPEFTCQVAGCCQVFAALEDYQHHYHMLHVNTCSLCNRAFPSGHLLDAHILEWHDSMFQILAQRQDMVGVGFTGSICSGDWDQGFGQGEGRGDRLSFVVPVLG